jgi:hypothetical protein
MHVTLCITLPMLQLACKQTAPMQQSSHASNIKISIKHQATPARQLLLLV